MQWIVGALYGGYIAANVFKWYWWRFNANGFFWGMTVGIIAALIFPYVFDDVLPLYVWPLLFLISIVGCIIGTYTARPSDEAVLKQFYKTVRPWGFWKPIHDKVMAEDPSFVPNGRFKLDMFGYVQCNTRHHRAMLSYYFTNVYSIVAETAIAHNNNNTHSHYYNIKKNMVG